ncbi:MAG: response regulator transcription factor [Bacillota bacterium]
MHKFLIVEDEALERRALRMILEKEFKDTIKIVGETGSGLEAVELDRQLKPDVVLMDINILDMNGLESSQRIKKRDENTIIIILTAYDEFEFAHKAIMTNVNDYILKPARPSRITESIHKQINAMKKNHVDMEDTIHDNESHGRKSEYQRSKEILQEVDYSDTSNIDINRIIEYIEKNCKKNITLEEVAEFAAVSMYYLSKLFKKKTGMNFCTYVVNRKMEIAMTLLENTDMPIINIAYELSYNEPNYFSKVFKKTVGITPSEYRNTNSSRGQQHLMKKSTFIPNGKWTI